MPLRNTIIALGVIAMLAALRFTIKLVAVEQGGSCRRLLVRDLHSKG